MACITVTQQDVDDLVIDLNTVEGITNVVSSGGPQTWFIDYDTDCGHQKFKVVVIEKELSATKEEAIGLELEP